MAVPFCMHNNEFPSEKNEHQLCSRQDQHVWVERVCFGVRLLKHEHVNTPQRVKGSSHKQRTFVDHCSFSCRSECAGVLKGRSTVPRSEHVRYDVHQFLRQGVVSSNPVLLTPVRVQNVCSGV